MTRGKGEVDTGRSEGSGIGKQGELEERGEEHWARNERSESTGIGGWEEKRKNAG